MGAILEPQKEIKEGYIAVAVTMKDGEEHQGYEWLSVEDAARRFTWPRAAHALADARRLLANGDAGPVEDVLKVL